MLLNLDQIRRAEVRHAPYPFFSVRDALSPATAAEAARAFPAIDRPGAVSVEETRPGPRFEQLLDELRGPAFRKLIAEKFDVDLDGKDTVINVRGRTRWTDGNIHTDTPSKLITVLLYFNEPGQAEGTGLRILRGNKDIDDFVEEIPAELGTMVAFKVTPDCWHGHRPFEGERHSLQLNYLSGQKTLGKHQLLHRLVSRAKRKLARA